MLADGAILGLYAALFLPWAVLLASGRAASAKWSHLIAVAVVARLAFLFVEPVLSDDIFRYIWDGYVALDGINPYLHAPASEALAHLRDAGQAGLWEKINHPQVPTIYPPVAQMLFWLNAALGGGDVLLRLLLLGVEAAGLFAAWWVLTRTGPAVSEAAMSETSLKRAFAIYALCPLVIVEIAWSGHVDVLAWMPLIVSLLLFLRARSLGLTAAAGALFGLSVAAKFLGVLALPLILFAKRSPNASLASTARRRALFLAVAAITVALTYLPYIDAGPKLFSGFGTYASTWQGNDGPFRAFSQLSQETLEDWAPIGTSTVGETRIMRVDDKLIFTFPHYDELFEKMGWTRQWQGMEVPATSFAADQIAQTVAKGVAAFLVGLAMLWALLVRRDPIAGTLLVLLTLFFVAPVVHPWYVAWLVPFAALRRSRTALVFSFVVLAAYVGWVSAQAGGSWQVPDWLVAVEFGVVGLVWFFEAAPPPRAKPSAPPPG